MKCESCGKEFAMPGRPGAASQVKYCSLRCKRRATNRRNYERRKKGTQIVNAVEARQFIQTWHDSANVSEVASKLGLSRQAVYSRKKYLEKNGIDLPKLEHSRRNSLSIDEIQELAKFNQALLKKGSSNPQFVNQDGERVPLPTETTE